MTETLPARESEPAADASGPEDVMGRANLVMVT